MKKKHSRLIVSAILMLLLFAVGTYAANADKDSTQAGITASTDSTAVVAPEAVAPAAAPAAPAPQRHVSTDGGWLRFQSILGVLIFLGIAFLMSNNRKRINWRTIGIGVALQFIMALLVFKTPFGLFLASAARDFVAKLLSFTDAGAAFVFGNLYLSSTDVVKSLQSLNAATLPGAWKVIDGVTGQPIELGMFFAIHVLPTIIFFGSLMAVLYHLGIMQIVVGAFAWVMIRAMGTSGAESLSCSGNIFLGQTEAPFLIRPFLAKMSKSEIMAVMTGGFATVAGGVMAAYVRFGIDAGQLLTASVMNAPAALVFAKLIFPETQETVTGKTAKIKTENLYNNVIDAAAAGASDGMKLAVNVAAMLIAFIALLAMLNGLLGFLGGFVGLPNLTITQILGWIFSPIAWAMGVQWDEIGAVASLLGTKISINEFVAYINLAGINQILTPRSLMIATFCLCGFANFSSIAIQVGGISALVPERRGDLASLGLKAMIAGALANCTTAAIGGVLFS